MMDIEGLIERGRQGDEDALGSLYKAYHRQMTGICQRIVGNRQVAEELAHDAFLLAFAKLDQLHNAQRFEAWLTSITTNVARRYVQRHHEPTMLSLSTLTEEEFPMEPIPSDDKPLPTMAELMAAVDALPNGYGQVFKLAVIQEMSHKEIADILGIAAHSSSSQLSRAKKMLQKSLAQAGGIRVVSSNWIYGARDILSTKQVKTPADLKGLKLRVSSNDLSVKSFESLGATPVGMDMSDVYQAMSGKTIDAVENPITSLYNRSFQEVGKYLCKDEHILATSMWICGESFYSTLTEEQQKWLCEAADEAGLYNNDLYEDATTEAEKGMTDAGVTIYTPTDAEKKEWIDAAQPFFETADKTMGWTADLYSTVHAIADGK